MNTDVVGLGCSSGLGSLSGIHKSRGPTTSTVIQNRNPSVKQENPPTLMVKYKEYSTPKYLEAFLDRCMSAYQMT